MRPPLSCPCGAAPPPGAVRCACGRPLGWQSRLQATGRFLAVGYGVVLVMMVAPVAVQNGQHSAMVVAGVDALLAAALFGTTLAGQALLARRGAERAWWVERALGYGLGLLLAGGVALVGSLALVSVVDLRDPGGPAPAIHYEDALGLAAVITGLDLVPLLLAFGLEAAARRVHPR